MGLVRLSLPSRLMVKKLAIRRNDLLILFLKQRREFGKRISGIDGSVGSGMRSLRGSRQAILGW